MPTTVSKNNKGFTLVEVMIALVVLLFVFLALMQTALMSIDSNMVNVLREEAISIAEEQMTDVRNTAYADVASVAAATVSRNIRNVQGFDYTVTRTVADNTTTKQVAITVTWSWKNDAYRHQITTILRRP